MSRWSQWRSAGIWRTLGLHVEELNVHMCNICTVSVKQNNRTSFLVFHSLPCVIEHFPFLLKTYFPNAGGTAL